MSKIFCLGLPRTGTKSFVKAFEILGIPAVHELSVAEDINHPAVQEALAEHDAFANYPWCLIYEDLLANYPDARFIIQQRPIDEWYESCVEIFGGNPHSFIRLSMFGARDSDPVGKKKIWKAYFRKHYATLEQYPFPEGQALWMGFADGWKPFCKFLGVAIPDVEWPHLNIGGLQ